MPLIAGLAAALAGAAPVVATVGTMRYVATGDRTAPMRFEVFTIGNRHELIAATGEITKDTPAAFRAFMASKPPGNWVQLDSGGGDLMAGLELGRAIRAAGLRTTTGMTVCPEDGIDGIFCGVLPGACESACAYAFAGGLERQLGYFVRSTPDYYAPQMRLLFDPKQPKGRIGLHEFAGGRAVVASGDAAAVDSLLRLGNSQAQYMSSLLASYLTEMGVDPAMLQLASRADPTTLHYPTDAELAQVRLTLTDRWLTPVLLPDGDGITAVSAFSIGGPSSAQVAFRCLPAEGVARPAIIASRARYWEGRLWATVGTVGVPAALNGLAALPWRSGPDGPIALSTHSGKAPSVSPELWTAPPDEEVGSAWTSVDGKGEPIEGSDVKVTGDANFTHFILFPTPATIAAILTARTVIVRFDGANVFALPRAEIALDEGARLAIRAAWLGCRQGGISERTAPQRPGRSG